LFARVHSEEEQGVRIKPMRATMFLTLIACCLFGQSRAQPAPRSQPNWLRVGLKMESADGQVWDLFTRQLRKLGDVEVVHLLRDHYPLDSNEVHDVRLEVLVSRIGTQELFQQPAFGPRRSAPPPRYAIAVVATHPADKDSQTKASGGDTRDKPMFDLDRQLFAAAWIVVADEKDLESKCADVIRQFDRDVLEVDRKRIRFAEPLPPPPLLPPQPQPPPPDTRGFGPSEGGGLPVSNHCDIDPSLIHQVEPEYSKEAQKAKYQGTVILYVEIDPTGNVVNPRVVRSLGLGLDEKAIEAVKKWSFRPGSSRDGKPVTCKATIEVNFHFRGH
jgi:TonB family protein